MQTMCILYYGPKNVYRFRAELALLGAIPLWEWILNTMRRSEIPDRRISSRI